MKRLRSDIFIYMCLIGISLLFCFVLIPQEILLRDSWSGDITFTSRTFPYILFATMGAVSLIGIIQTVFKMKNCIKSDNITQLDMTKIIKKTLVPIYFFLLIGVYAFLFAKVGYIIATVVIIPLYLLSLKCKKWQYYLIVYGVATIIYVVFKFALNIPL